MFETNVVNLFTCDCNISLSVINFNSNSLYNRQGLIDKMLLNFRTLKMEAEIFLPKRSNCCTSLYDVTFHKTVIFIVKLSSNLAQWNATVEHESCRRKCSSPLAV